MSKNQEQDEFIAVRVQDPRVQNEGFWNSYVDFKIFLHTNSKAFTAKTSCVRRRYSEFVWLRKKLQKNAGLVPVPELPRKMPFFSFSNEDFIERRRQGLQHFLDKVVHLTVCLSDSQLHLFLQTQLPVGHIEDCVQGHTPYTVTDAILTYASSNRGWAQEEEDVTLEPSPCPVPYESVDSPAPHLPSASLQCADSFERASEANTPKEDTHNEGVRETNSNKHDALDTDDILMLRDSEADANNEDAHKINAHKADDCLIKATQPEDQEEEAHKNNTHEAHGQEFDTCVLRDSEVNIPEMDASQGDVCEAVIQKEEPHETGTHKASAQNTDTSVTMATENNIQEEEAHETNTHQADTHDHDSIMFRDSEVESHREDISDEGIHMEDVDETNSQDTDGRVVGAIEADIQEQEMCETNGDKADTHDHNSIVLRNSELDTLQEDGSEENVHEPNGPKPDTQGTDSSVLWDSEADPQEEDSRKTTEDIVDTKDSNAYLIRVSDIDLQKNGASIANSNVGNDVSDSEADAVEEDTQDTNSDNVNSLCANSFAFNASEAIIHQLDGYKADAQTKTQEVKLHETESHTESSGQQENMD
ncbi:sorting nexin-11 [Megalops cyprinoides]|uniref:sorting nexin-11 n=1 Tax=Megalops cyprinoides TaxID=118141 RepID=UPI001864CCC8|nr:sorting nexin-11 [Megalops cyprinoides]